MHDTRPRKNYLPPVWQEKLAKSGYLVGAILLHLVIFLLIATFVIWKAPAPPDTTEFKATTVHIAPPPPQPPSSDSAAQNPQFEPDPVIVPTVTPPAMVTTSAMSIFNVDSIKLPSNMTHFSDQNPQGTGLNNGSGSAGSGSGSSTAFGASTAAGNQLQGYLYDLKQTADGKPTNMTPELYHQILIKFVDSGWNESILAPYYKSPNPLFTSHILVPMMDAAAGPKAFGLEKEVQPKMWIIWYKAKVSAPASASYRFVGFCDDILLVRVAGDTVLDGSINLVDTQLKVTTPWPNTWVSSRDYAFGQLRQGPKVSFTGGLSTNLDIIIGEEPGGHFNASLFIMNDEETYATDSSGQIVLPLFQLGTPVEEKIEGIHPPISKMPEPWNGESR